MKICKNCEYWDKDYIGLCSNTFKPCKHPNRPKNINNISETKYSEDNECTIKIKQLY